MEGGAQPSIVMFSGGSAGRSINIALSQKPVHLTRVVPGWDSGGSSKILREQFDNFLSIGDIRQALMTMAHGEGFAGEVVKIFNSRISDNLGREEARKEFLYFADGQHPLLSRMEAGLRGAVLNYLQTFQSRIGDDFDFRNGSIGNFILTGAYLAHNDDINTAIFVFRKLCGLRGSVWPSSRDNGVDLSAVLQGGRRVEKQHRITALSDEDMRAGVADIYLARQDSQPVVANDAVLEAIATADLIVFGPGSFFTSLLPHLLVDGVVDAIVHNTSARRVLVTNVLQCRETFSRTARDLATTFETVWRQRGGEGMAAFTHVLANRPLFPFEKTVGAYAYLEIGDETGSLPTTPVWQKGEYEDAWNRGTHDGQAVADALMTIASDCLSTESAAVG